MARVDNYYSSFSRSFLDDFDYDSQISEYLVDLLSKDYKEISSTWKYLLENDKNLRHNLHKFVIDSASVALKNINCCTNTSEEVNNLSKTCLDVSKASTSCGHKSSECADFLSIVVEELNNVNQRYSEYKFVNSLVRYINTLDVNCEIEKLSHLLSFKEVLINLPDSKQSKLAMLLTDKVQKILQLRESELFNSFNNDPADTAKIISLIKTIGCSSDEDISTGFLRNRLSYLKDCFRSCLELSRNELQRGMEESVSTLKKAHLVSLCYKSVFGDVDFFLSTFMNLVFHEFFETVRQVFKESGPENFKNLDFEKLEIKMAEISGLLSPLGLSFDNLVDFNFKSFLNEGF